MTNRELAIDIIRRLKREGYTALLAGGCVRDRLLRKRPKDYDVATDATPDEVQRLFRRTLNVGARFGVTVVLRDRAAVEVSTFRSDEAYVDGRHPTGVRFTTHEEDARRRDFTINAMFHDPLRGKTIDPVGGMNDLQRGLVRAVGDPEDRFREDHLRMLRAVRFTARLRFRLAPATRRAIRKLAPLIRETSGERIRDELAQMLTEPTRVEAMRLAYELHLLGEILPEVTAMRGCRQGARAHPEGDVWQHTLKCLEALRKPTFLTALATLLHDIGKPPTADYAGGNVRFYRHAAVGADMAADVANRLRLSRAQRDELVWVIRHHLDFMQIREMRNATLKRLFQSQHFPTLAEVYRADLIGSGASTADYRYLRRTYRKLKAENLKPPALVTGHDVLALGLSPGPAVGRILRTLYEEQLNGHLTDRDRAMQRTRELVRKEIEAGATKGA